MTRKELIDEIEFTPWAEPGWLSYNGMSPEVDVCEFVAMLVRLMKPTVVVETGVGQGYMTRAIIPQLSDGQMLLAYESDDIWRSEIAQQTFWLTHKHRVTLSPDVSPSAAVLALADLCFFDSDFPFRLQEIPRWYTNAKRGAVAVIHDTGERHEAATLHATVKELIVELGMSGFFLHNPRGCFVAIKA
jgi:predicted O-methyltransferase YrrM